MKLVVIAGNGNLVEVVYIYKGRIQWFNELLSTEDSFACRRPPEI
jgi:hypothetical protein